MRFANHDNRLTLITEPEADLSRARGLDVHRASGGSLPHEPELALERWDEVLDWAAGVTAPADVAIDPLRLAAPSPRPRQIFGIGVNYADHGSEAGMERPEVPLVFTKLAPAITGPFATIELATQAVDWEVEIVVVIGRAARAVGAASAWHAVAGVTAGQDLSDRDIQWRPQATPQFSLGKSLPGFAPLGPLLVTPDEFPDPDDIELACHLNGEEVQRSRSSLMLFSVPELIAYLSSITPLHPGDVIFTGTPSGIGMTRTPPRYLAPGDRLDSFVEGVGTMSHTLRAVPTTQVAD
jgi:2,4-didehydro-3-deoxy-L-rhamnonate hydrolase